MKLFVIAIYDLRTKTYGPPQVQTSTGSSIRSFEDQVTGVIQADPTLKNHPGDFELHQLATWDDQTGKFTNEKTELANGANYQRTSPVNARHDLANGNMPQINHLPNS